MGNEVQISVRSKLLKIIEELDQIEKKGKGVSAALKGAGANVGDSITEQAKKTENFMDKLTSMGRRAADQLKGDFKSLLSINAISESMKISEQFRGSVKEALQLNDTIRKLGASFGIAGKDFAKFQSEMMKGLGELGLGEAAGANALQGLSGTGVKGSSNIVQYARSAGQLASITNQSGREGDIAKGLAETIRARGGDPNSAGGMKEMGSVAEDLRRAFNQTGKSPTEILGSMKDLFSGMSQDFRKNISSHALVGLAAAGQVAGPNSTKFLEDLMGKSPIARRAIEAQGGKGIINGQGLDVDKFRTFSKAILARVGGDPRLAAQTLGLSEDSAEGFIRLSESLDRVKEAQDAMSKSTGSVEEQYRSSMGAGEAFKASINRVKSMVAGPLSEATQGISNLLSHAAGSNAGAAATVLGGGALAATLAGFGMKGIGKGMGMGGMLKGGAIEAATGRQVQPVYVVNASDIAEGGTGTGLPGGLLDSAKTAVGGLGKMGPAAAGAGALVGGSAAGYALANVESGPLGEFNKWIRSLMPTAGAENDANSFAKKNEEFRSTKQQKVIIELNKRDLKESKQPTRGASQ